MTKTSSILFWVSLTIFASAVLYHTSYRVQDLSRQLRSLNAEIETERTNIHVLKAEWVYLANPAKIEQAARRHLALQPTAIKQLTKLEDLSDVLPTRTEAMANVTVESTPIATVASTTKAASVPLAPRRKLAIVKDHSHINVSMVMQHSAKPVPRSINEILLAESDPSSTGKRP